MRKLVLFEALVIGSLAVIPVACTPDVPQVNSANVVVALFDPAAPKPVVPTPTDLVFSPAKGTLDIPIDPGASDAEKEFLSYLNSLDGYPGDTPAHATFNGTLNPSSVNANSIRVMEVTAGYAGVTGPAISYSATPNSQIAISPAPTGWKTGKIYAIAR